MANFNAAMEGVAPAQAPVPVHAPPPPPSGPPPLGSILQLAKESGRSRKECKAALIEHANDYDAARWALMPELAPPEEPAAPSTGCCGEAVPNVFEPAPKFDGGRPGWLYKSGPLGTGYYRDAPIQAPASCMTPAAG